MRSRLAKRMTLPIAPVGRPDNAEAPAPDELTALRRHAAFFDRDGDGSVTIGEVLETLRLLGCGDAYAHINAIGGMLARTTEPGLLSHDVAIANAHRGKYRDPDLNGETRIFDRHGRFDAARFDEVLARYGRSGVDGLTEADVAAMIADISLPGSVGRSSSRLAFRLLMTIAGEQGPQGELVLTRARLRAFYEGTLLPELIAERADAQRQTDPVRNEPNDSRPRQAPNREPIASTLGGVLLGAARVVCPFDLAS